MGAADDLGLTSVNDQLIDEEERKRRKQQQLPGGRDPLAMLMGSSAAGALGLIKAPAGVMQ